MCGGVRRGRVPDLAEPQDLSPYMCVFLNRAPRVSCIPKARLITEAHRLRRINVRRGAAGACPRPSGTPGSVPIQAGISVQWAPVYISRGIRYISPVAPVNLASGNRYISPEAAGISLHRTLLPFSGEQLRIRLALIPTCNAQWRSSARTSFPVRAGPCYRIPR